MYPPFAKAVYVLMEDAGPIPRGEATAFMATQDQEVGCCVKLAAALDGLAWGDPTGPLGCPGSP